MDNAAEALLIIVSATLSIFLVVGIIALIKWIRIMKHVEVIVEKAENVAGSVEAAASSIQKGAASASVLSVIGNIVSSVQNRKK
jgi:hypothetical protein